MAKPETEESKILLELWGRSGNLEKLSAQILQSLLHIFQNHAPNPLFLRDITVNNCNKPSLANVTGATFLLNALTENPFPDLPAINSYLLIAAKKGQISMLLSKIPDNPNSIVPIPQIITFFHDGPFDSHRFKNPNGKSSMINRDGKVSLPEKAVLTFGYPATRKNRIEVISSVLDEFERAVKPLQEALNHHLDNLS